ncbi:MAG: efflux RND transporter periplasmic adaptor subunit [Candidatus Peregrinibacteria bacterium]|nr:efflux RND transporter periplasmic adaptor subunit [Candidatus Peregrinibacteria bacterium]
MKLKFFALSVLTLFALSACGDKVSEEITLPPPSVQVLDLSKPPVYHISEVGQVKAQQEVELIAKAAGTIGQISAKIGDEVEAGRVLAVIDFDETNNPARVNYDTVNLQLSGARQNYSQIQANNQDQITRAGLRVQTLESTLSRLQRNLDELRATNETTRATMELQVENANQNLDTAEVNYQNLLAQFEQSWEDLLASTQTSLDGVWVNVDSQFARINDFMNPYNISRISSGDLNRYFGARSSLQKNDTTNAYNDYKVALEESKTEYSRYLPLNEVRTAGAIDLVHSVLDDFRNLLSMIRVMLNNSIAGSGLPQGTLDAYLMTVSTAEGIALGDTSALNMARQRVEQFKLDRITQTATAENNVVIAGNRLAEAQNALNQFQIGSVGSLHDLEAQITQTSNELLAAQADMASAQRNLSISGTGQRLEISTLENQLRLAEQNLDNNQITSSIKGTLSEFTVDEGDYVTPGFYLGRVIQRDSVKIVTYLSKENADRLTLGQSFEYEIEGGEKALGVISKIAPSADPANKKIRVEGVAANKELELKPETFINLQLDLSTEAFEPGSIYVPMNAIIFTQNNQYVFVVEDGLARKQDVEIGDLFDNFVEITNGLSQSDLLIVEGHRNLPATRSVEVHVTN